MTILDQLIMLACFSNPALGRGMRIEQLAWKKKIERDEAAAIVYGQDLRLVPYKDGSLHFNLTAEEMADMARIRTRYIKGELSLRED